MLACGIVHGGRPSVVSGEGLCRSQRRTQPCLCRADKLPSGRRQVGTGLLISAMGLMGSSCAAADEGLPWAQTDDRRMLHPVLVVKDLKQSQDFYSEVLNMSTLRYRSFPDGSANGFSGYLPEEAGMAFELVQKAAPPAVRVGSGFRHFTVAVPSIEAALQRAMARGCEIVEGAAWESGEVYIRDPSGYLWEVTPLMSPTTEPVREINLLVSDLAASTRFYCDLLGMRVLREEQSDDYKRVWVCWGPEASRTALALTRPSRPPAAPVDRGSDAYIQIAVSSNDIYRTTEAVRAGGGAITREPAPVPGIGTKVAKVADPDGWVIALVDTADFNGELCKAGSGSAALCEPGEPAP